MTSARLPVLALAALVLLSCGRNFDRKLQERMSADPLSAYGGGFDPARLDAGPLPEVDGAALGRALVFVVPPFYAQEINQGAARALQEWLRSRVGVPVEIRAPDAYAHEKIAQGLADGSIDVAELSPYAYALMEQRGLGLVPLAATVAHGSSTYASYLVVKRGSDVHHVSDLRGKRIALVDPLSTSGFLLPMAFLKRRGFDVDKDFTFTFAGSHPAAVDRLRAGEVDAAAVSSDLLIGQSGLAGPLRVIAKAGRLPNDVIVAREDLPIALRERVRVALLRLSIHDDAGRDALKAFSAVDAFMPVPDGHYDEVRALVRDTLARTP